MKLYAANPPLYGATINKKKVFFADNMDYIEYIQNLFCKENTICNLKNRVYTKKEITAILYKNRYYIDELNKVSNTYSIDPYVLEFLLYNRSLDQKKLVSLIKKTFKYVEVNNINNTLVLKILYNNSIQTIFFTNRLFNDCIEVIKLIDRSEDYYILNGKQVSIYGLMTIFSNFEPKNITRYKGLTLGRLYGNI